MKYYICDWGVWGNSWASLRGPLEINEAYRIAQELRDKEPHKYFGICEGSSIPDQVIPSPIQNIYI